VDHLLGFEGEDAMSIDLNFRPTSYADFDDPVSLALNGIKGQMRREMARDMLTAEGEQRAVYDAVLGPIDEEVLRECASTEFTDNLNHAFGPSWMGGEYLPDLMSRELEIARIVLASVTMDVISVRAKLCSSRYHYSIRDEYETEFTVRPETSQAPLTLGALIGLIDTADGQDLATDGCSLVDAWWWQQWEYGQHSPQECTDFAWAESEQYPKLADYFEERARQWRIARAPEWAERTREAAS
jgi:hypothetical protein